MNGQPSDGRELKEATMEFADRAAAEKEAANRSERFRGYRFFTAVEEAPGGAWLIEISDERGRHVGYVRAP